MHKRHLGKLASTRAMRDLQQHRRIYDMISRVYGELFEWVRRLVSISESECFCEPYITCVRQMENYLQEEFEMLMEVVSV